MKALEELYSRKFQGHIKTAKSLDLAVLSRALEIIYNLRENMGDFAGFSSISSHHKWNRTRLLSPESQWIASQVAE